jgi:hypothetical protein
MQRTKSIPSLPPSPPLYSGDVDASITPVARGIGRQPVTKKSNNELDKSKNKTLIALFSSHVH